VDCYVIEADVPNKGKYTVWIDPFHDFYIARIQVQRQTGDRIWNQVMQEKDTHKEFFEVLEYEKNGDMWFPKTCIQKRTGQGNDYKSTEERETSFSTISLNSNHDAMGSFLPDDIPNGTPTHLMSRPPSEEYIWQDCKAVPVEDKITRK
jgi:hypothetical protein